MYFKKTWEKLKEYADKIGAKVYSNLIIFKGVCFWEEGLINQNDEDTFAYNRTPDQMYQIMEALK